MRSKNTNKILIDATYPEQTRLAILLGNRLETYDQEITSHKSLKGNIYLAKVTRVEPSLQACFVDYGRERHGFLSLTEIHPDYYRIPTADKKALLEEFYREQEEEKEWQMRSFNNRRKPRYKARGNRGTAPSYQDNFSTDDDGRDDLESSTETPPERPRRASRRSAYQSDNFNRMPADENSIKNFAPIPMNDGRDNDRDDDKNDGRPNQHEDFDLTNRMHEGKQTLPMNDGGDEYTKGDNDNSQHDQNGNRAVQGNVAEKNAEDNEHNGEHADKDRDIDPTNGDKSIPAMMRGRAVRRSKKISDSRNDSNNASDDETTAPMLADDLDFENPNNQPTGAEIDNNEINDGNDLDDDENAEKNGRMHMSHYLKRRRYKIQEVIKKGQIILVQVVKDERGNKGAALTSYLSLAGRYTVLMPNTTKGGGISRKISPQERNRMRDILRTLDIPRGMGIILRTAGADQDMENIKADYDYVRQLWDKIRELTMNSTAPSMIYEEGSLIKKAIRNYNDSNIDEIWIEGKDTYDIAMETMQAISPKEIKKLHFYNPKEHRHKSIFQFYGIEQQIQDIYEPDVMLYSGGMLVINQTEALVAIDVNSGRAIRERNIEETALRTNLEAAEEVARQLRLRDLSGQIVIDFIDMEDNRNIYRVEQAFREHLRKDRARVQVSRIGMFGMLEMTRQRLRPSITETIMQECPHCRGTGKNFKAEYYSLQFLRELFSLVQEKGGGKIIAEVPADLAQDLLSNKRVKLNEIEKDYKVELVFADLPRNSLAPYTISFAKEKATRKTKGHGRKVIDYADIGMDK